MRKYLIGFCALIVVIGVCGFSSSAMAADSGKSFAMAGAFVAVADDLSAQFYNPAGLTQVKKRTAGLSLANSSLTLSSPSSPVSYSSSFFNLLENEGLILPLGRFVLAVGSETVLDNYLEANVTGAGYISNLKYSDFIYAPGLALGSEFYPNLSLGLNLSYLLRKGVIDSRFTASYGSTTTNVPVDGSSIGATGGLLFKPHSSLLLGAVIRYLGDVNVSSTWRGTETGTADVTGTFSFTEKYPLNLSAGLAFRPQENLTLALQADLVNAQDYKITYSLTGPGAPGPSEVQVKTNSVVGIHAGFEYLIPAGAAVVPLRAGYFTRPSNTDALGASGGLQPFFNTSTIALGSGYDAGNFGVDVGAQFITMSKNINGTDINLSDTKILISSFINL